MRSPCVSDRNGAERGLSAAKTEPVQSAARRETPKEEKEAKVIHLNTQTNPAA